MTVKRINELFLDAGGNAIFRDKTGWRLDGFQNKGEGRTFRELSQTGYLADDAILFPFLDQRCIVKETYLNGSQILDIYMEWEV